MFRGKRPLLAGTKLRKGVGGTGQRRDLQFGTIFRALGLAHDSSPFVAVYDWRDAQGFGVKAANPGTLPTN